LKKTVKKVKKLSLHRETLVHLETPLLGQVAGNATLTASNPCCPRTRVGCG